MREVAAEEAAFWFHRLPLKDQIATLSPTYVWVDSRRDKALSPCFLHYREGDNFWQIGMHKSHIPNSEFFDLRAPYGYGGPYSNSKDPEFIDRAWMSYRKWCWDNYIVAEFVRLHPLMEQPYLGDVKDNRTVYTCGADYTQKCRNMVNKATRLGLQVLHACPSVIRDHFPVDYRKAMADKKTDSFYLFNDDYFDALSKMPGVNLLICEEDEQWRSAAIFLAGGLSMEYHLSITNERGRQIGATNLLIHMARSGMRDGELYLGGGRTTSEDDSLAKFKASFGGRRLSFRVGTFVHRPEVYKEMKGANETDRVLCWR